MKIIQFLTPFLKQLWQLFKPFFFLIAAILFAYKQGKNSVKNKENEEAANAIRKLNKTKKDVSHLSDSDLDSELQKWRRLEDK